MEVEVLVDIMLLVLQMEQQHTGEVQVIVVVMLLEQQEQMEQEVVLVVHLVQVVEVEMV